MEKLHNSVGHQCARVLFTEDATSQGIEMVSVCTVPAIVREPEGWSVSYWGANSTIHFRKALLFSFNFMYDSLAHVGAFP